MEALNTPSSPPALRLNGDVGLGGAGLLTSAKNINPQVFAKGVEKTNKFTKLTNKFCSTKVQSNNPKLIKNKQKIMCWNKGNAMFDTKKDELEIIINEHAPLILGVLEANVEADYFLPALNIEGYSTEVDNLHSNGHKARTIVYINEEAKYKRRLDLEPPNSPTIWIEIMEEKKKSFLIFIGYREWCPLHSSCKKKVEQ